MNSALRPALGATLPCFLTSVYEKRRRPRMRKAAKSSRWARTSRSTGRETIPIGISELAKHRRAPGLPQLQTRAQERRRELCEQRARAGMARLTGGGSGRGRRSARALAKPSRLPTTQAREGPRTVPWNAPAVPCGSKKTETWRRIHSGRDSPPVSLKQNLVPEDLEFRAQFLLTVRARMSPRPGGVKRTVYQALIFW
jgi:hypothetical protein